MKKIASLIILLATMFSLFACTSNNSASQGPVLNNAELWKIARYATIPQSENNTQIKMTIDLDMSYSGTKTSTTAEVKAIVKNGQAYMYMLSAGMKGEVWYKDDYLYYKTEYMGETDQYKKPGTLKELKEMIAEDANFDDFSFFPTEAEIEAAKVTRQGSRTIMTITFNPENHTNEIGELAELGTIQTATVAYTFDAENHVNKMKIVFKIVEEKQGLDAKIVVNVDLSRLDNPANIVFPSDLDTYKLYFN